MAFPLNKLKYYIFLDRERESHDASEKEEVILLSGKIVASSLKNSTN